MTKIPLRSYTREIESLIERGMTEEAIGHCRFILKYYPKHIETYKLLGKSFLESQRYSEAADILQRLLSVYPDDFFAQIGMSIIREDEGNLDAAIFHMERAYETQPANVAIQDELRRLYGRRDGIEPPKLRLSRGALVRMYARGGLSRQATAEITAALAEDPQRLDLEVILAKIYHHTGAKVEAVEIASRLLTKLPYCFDANLIMAEILPSTAHAKDAQIYLDRLLAMDPYLAHLSPSIPTSAQVPDNAVLIDRLVWQPSESAQQQPAWAQSIGIKIEQDAEPEKPDWLTEVTPHVTEIKAVQPEPESFSEPITFDETEIAPVEAELPGWMREAGWSLSTSTQEEPPAPIFTDFEETSADGEPSKADLPDWLKNLAPLELDSNASLEEDQEKIDILDKILPPAMETSTESVASIEPTTEAIVTPIEGSDPTSDLPDWLRDFSAKHLDTETATSQSLTTEEADQVPDWFTKSDFAAQTQEPETATMPELKVEDQQVGKIGQMASDQVDEEVNAMLGSENIVADLPSSDAIMPDWLSALSAEKSEETEQNAVAANPLPDWLQGIEQLEETGVPQLAVVALEESLPSDLNLPEPIEAIQEPPEIEQPESTSDSTFDAIQEESPQIQLPEAVVEPSLEEELPVLKSEVEEIIQEIQTDQESTILAISTEISHEKPEEFPGLPDLSDADAAMAWLESLAAKQGADEETLITRPEDRPDSAPDWVRESSILAQEETPAIPASDSLSLDQLAESLEPEFEPVSPPLPEEPQIVKSISVEDPFMEPVSPPIIEESLIIEPVPVEEPSFEPGLLPLAEEPLNIESFPVEEPSMESPVSSTDVSPSAQPPADMDFDTAFAWLESLAAQQGADAGTLITPPEERREAPPAWVTEPSLEEAASPTQPVRIVIEEPIGVIQTEESSISDVEFEAESSLVPVVSEDTTPDVAEIIIPPVEESSTKAEEESGLPQTSGLKPLPDWLKGMETEPVPAPLETSENAELPDWLQGLESKPQEKPPQGVVDASEPLPDWINNLAVAEETTEAPAVETAPSQEATPTWLLELEASQQNDQASESLEETITSENIAKYDEQEAIPSGTESPGMLLNQAQTALTSGKIEISMRYYSRLIQNNAFLDEAIHDLRDGLYRFPVDISIWQTLGDAYMRNNQIQEALDAYTKAEEFLR